MTGRPARWRLRRPGHTSGPVPLGAPIAEPPRSLGAREAGPVRRRDLAAVALGLVALVLVQVALVAAVPTPGAAPDLVIVAVLALAATRGPVVGGLAGAWAGLLLDVVPPAAGVLGGWMLVLGVAGYVVGRMSDTARPGPIGTLLLVALGAAGVVLGRAAVLWFAGAGVDASVLVTAAASAVLALVLAPLALLLLSPRPRPRTAPVRVVPAELTP